MWSGSRGRTDLPAEFTSFIDRRDELAATMQLVREARLVTLTGLGGVGKTRLALRVAAALRDEFPDGVCLVELSPLQNGDLLPYTLAAALQLQHQTVHPLQEVIFSFLADKRLLLVLDTCEVLIEPCARLAGSLLRTAPELRILATSRQPLGVLGEHTRVVPPLTTPPPNERASDPSAFDAVVLFIERAREIAGLSLTADNKDAIASICRRLDGIPLAIELAAVRMNVLSPEQILARLDDRFRLLSGGSTTAPARHQTLRAAIGWSQELCSPLERLLWARLSVFGADFDLAAAEDVCASAELPAEEIFETLASLVDKSIVVTTHYADGVRYRLLDTVRDYGREWLARLEEEPRLRRRHRDYYLRLAEKAEADWSSPRQVRWLARLRHEYPHLQDALGYSLIDPADADTGMHFAAVLWPYWIGCGFVSEGRHWLDRALAGHAEISAGRVKALWVSGTIAYLQGDLKRSRQLLEQARADALTLGDELNEAEALQRLGAAHLLDGDPAGAIVLLDDAIEAMDRLGRTDTQGFMARVVQGVAHTFLGDLDKGEDLATQGLKAAVSHGDLWARGYALYTLALVATARGDLGAGIAHAGESLHAHHELYNLVGIAMDIELLASLRAGDGAAEDAAVLHGAAAPLWRATGKRLFGSATLDGQHEQTAQGSRQVIGDVAYEAAYRRGSALTLDEAVAFALQGGPSKD